MQQQFRALARNAGQREGKTVAGEKGKQPQRPIDTRNPLNKPKSGMAKQRLSTAKGPDRFPFSS